MAMPWQPMPAAATLPSGTTVERLCGQPEQKKAVAREREKLGPLLELVDVADARLDGLDPELFARSVWRWARAIRSRVELANHLDERPVLLVALCRRSAARSGIP